jgi:hypothetical protein
MGDGRYEMGDMRLEIAQFAFSFLLLTYNL